MNLVNFIHSNLLIVNIQLNGSQFLLKSSEATARDTNHWINKLIMTAVGYQNFESFKYITPRSSFSGQVSKTINVLFI
jgi:hypothetical protein